MTAAPRASVVRAHHIRVARSARYFELGPTHGMVRELWFVLHGYGDLAERFLAPFAAIDDGSRVIVAPEALNRFYTVPASSAPASERPVGATWMTREDRDREIDDYVAYLEDVAADVAGRLTGKSVGERVVVLGFSQGAATAARWVARGRVRAHELVLWGGVLPPELELRDRDQPLRRATLTIVIGSQDDVVPASALEVEKARLAEAGIPYTLRRYEGRHAISRAELVALAATLGRP